MHHHTHYRKNERRVFRALWLTGTFMLVEVAGGLIAGSLALLADAGHMLTDTAALALAYGAFRLSRRPADQRRSYGYDRLQVVAAFLNGVVLLALVAWIAFEAVSRILTPQPVLALPMLAVAVAGLAVNLVAYRILHAGAGKSLNVQGALLHVLFDIFGSVAAIAAALVIMATGWTQIDPILSIVVAALILKSGWVLVKKATHILMEGTPDAFNVKALKKDLVKSVPGLMEVHHVHLWLLTSERPLITLHATVADIRNSEAILIAIKKRLQEKHGIGHSTVQIESETCADPH